MKPYIIIASAIAFLLFPLTGYEQSHSQLDKEKIDCALCHTCLHPTEENPCLVDCPRGAEDILPLERMGPDVVILDELSEVEDLYVPVRFNHETHAHMSSTVEGCEMCHHYNENSITPSSCSECHPIEILHENLAQPGLKGAYHRQCMDCHMEWDPNTSCEICHEKKSGGRLNGTATTYSEERIYPEVKMRDLIMYESEDIGSVPFHHKTHAYKYDRNCGDCHQQQGCEVCHEQGLEVLQPMGDLQMDEMHDQCFVCHENDECEHCHGRDQNDVFVHAEDVGWPLKKYHNELHCRDCHVKRGEFTKLESNCNNCHGQGWDLDDFKHQLTGVELDEMHQMAECSDCHEETFKIVQGNAYPQTSEIKTSCINCHDDAEKFNPNTAFKSES